MPCTYQIQNVGTSIHYLLFFLSVLGKSLKSLLGKRQGKGNQQSIKFFAKFYNNTSQVAWVLGFLLPVSLNGSLTLLNGRFSVCELNLLLKEMHLKE